MAQESASLGGVSAPSDDYDRIFAWLAGPNFAPALRDSLDKAIDGTGQWFLKSTPYCDWVSGDTNVLWCKGPNGIGKTVLISLAINNLQETRGAEDGIGYIFFDNELHEEQTATNIMKALICQLIVKSKHISENTVKVYEWYTSQWTNATFEDCCAILLSQIADFERVYFVIDAIEKCRVQVRLQFLDALLRLKKERPQLYFLITSTDTDLELVELWDPVLYSLEARVEDLAGFIERQMKYKARLQQFFYNHTDLVEVTKTSLIERADGMYCFLLIILQLELLEATKAKNSAEYLDQLQQLPRGSDMLEQTYIALWKRILKQDDEDAHLAKAILTWLCFADIPRDVTTLRHALAAARSDLTYIVDTNLIEQEMIISVCLGLIIISDTTFQVRFVHHTAQEFFARFLQEEVPDAHFDIAKACIQYLSMETFDSDITETQITSTLQQYPLLEFAAKTWGFHALRSPGKDIRPVLHGFLKTPTKTTHAARILVLCRAWEFEGVPEIPRDVVGPHLAAYHGLIGTLYGLADFEQNIDIKDSNGWTPLRWAAYGCQSMTVGFLIDSGSNLEIPDSCGESTLMWGLAEPEPRRTYRSIYAHGNATVRLGDGIEDAIPFGLQSSSAGYASIRTSDEIITILIARLIEVNLKDQSGRTALSRAAENHQVSYVSQLVERGADRDSEDDHGMTALLWSLQWPHDVSNLRVFTNIQAPDRTHVHIGDMFTVTPGALQSCSQPTWTGNEDMIKLLIGSNYRTKDMNGKKALSLAAERSYVEVVKALLDRTVDLDSLDIPDMAPLRLASMRPCFQELMIDDLLVSDMAKVICGPVFHFPDGIEALQHSDEVPIFFQRRADIINLYLDKIVALGGRIPNLRPFVRLASRASLTNIVQVLRQKYREYTGDVIDPEEAEEVDMNSFQSFGLHRTLTKDKGKITVSAFGAVDPKLWNIATHSNVRITLRNSQTSGDAKIVMGAIFTDQSARLPDLFEVTKTHVGGMIMVGGDDTTDSDLESPEV